MVLLVTNTQIGDATIGWSHRTKERTCFNIHILF
uniref:Uncharacterized protein n=1 Tax=Arundo donax TaxID=35708 RepID=A0A0A9BW92_ARUDO